ncbi:MAG: hypothetical protein Tsb0020_01540 [Haliangiales bacterium]
MFHHDSGNEGTRFRVAIYANRSRFDHEGAERGASSGPSVVGVTGGEPAVGQLDRSKTDVEWRCAGVARDLDAYLGGSIPQLLYPDRHFAVLVSLVCGTDVGDQMTS